MSKGFVKKSVKAFSNGFIHFVVGRTRFIRDPLERFCIFPTQMFVNILYCENERNLYSKIIQKIHEPVSLFAKLCI